MGRTGATPPRGPERGPGRGGTGLRVVVAGMPWPVETFVDRLLGGLADTGHEIIVLSDTRPSSTWLARRRATWWPGPDVPDPRTIVKTARKGTSGAIGTVLDVVHRRAGLPGPDDADVLYAPWVNALTTYPHLLDLGLPVITSCRGALVTVAPWNPRRHEHTSRLPEVFERAALVHCVSEAIQHDAERLGLDPEKARVIRPAVDPADFAPGSGDRTDGTFEVVGTGSLIWRKAYEHALIAVARAADRGVDIRLRLLGDGPDRQHLRYAAQDLGLETRVELVGSCTPTEVREALQRADAFLHMSSSEGISNAVLEAMATGLPVVTTDVGGMGEAVRDGVEGFLVGVRDVEAAATALTSLAGDADLRRRMGAAGRERVERSFRLHDQVQAFDRLLHEAHRTR